MLIQSRILSFYFNPHQDPIDQKEARGRKRNCKRCLSPFFFFFFFCTSSFEKPCVAVTISYHSLDFLVICFWHLRVGPGWRGGGGGGGTRRPLSAVPCLWLAIRNVCSLHCPTVPIMIRRSNITEAHTMYYSSLAP